MIIGPVSGIAPVGGGLTTARVGGPAPAAPVGTDFSSVLADLTSSAVNTLKAGESTAISGIQGQVPVQQVVESVMSAEQALQTAIAVRDKLVAAYQQISQMQI